MIHLIFTFLAPWLIFFVLKRPFLGLVCLILQLTLLGWIPAFLWTVWMLGQFKGKTLFKQLKGGFELLLAR